MALFYLGVNMSFTKDDLEAVNSAIASGELVVEVNGRKVQYRSIKELLEARRLIAADLAGQQGKKRSAFRGFAVRIDRGIR